ncbi:MAG: metallophosphoesterase [Gemmatimonadota bacterium]
MTRRLTRRRFLLGAAGVTAAALVEGVGLGPRRLSVSTHIVGTPRTDRPAVRIAQLSDLHLKGIEGIHVEAADVLAEWGADLVIMSGDAIDRDDAIPVLEDFLTLLPDGPVRVASLGNWEHWSGVSLPDLEAAYRAFDCTLLVNQGLDVDVGEHAVRVYGLDDWLAGEADLARATEGDPLDASSLVISHCPAWRDEPEAREEEPGLVLSGHTHGGQVALGRWAPLLPPGSGGYVSGWYRESGPPTYVSRGLGTSVIPVRLGCTPELALFEWHPDSSS